MGSPRRIVSISAVACGHDNNTVLHTALADDGTAWIGTGISVPVWKQVPPLPDKEGE